MPIRDQEAFLTPGDAGVRFLANRGANGIDGLISSGVGAALASEAPAWIVTGDLGLHHDSNGLAALRHAEVPVRVVVLNNDGGGIFEHLPQAAQLDRSEFERLLATPLGVDIEALAAAYGVSYRRIESVDELGDAAGHGTGVIEARIDRAANVAVRNRFTEAASAALEHG
jgi:2-succinyl-5-enolpyruvyl-6-hydroxy-3-cyclohexene-1-carboxylate synthase